MGRSRRMGKKDKKAKARESAAAASVASVAASEAAGKAFNAFRFAPAVEESVAPSQLRTLAEKLASSVPLHRSTAATTISNIALQSQSSARDLIGQGALRYLLPLITDTDAEVRVHAAGALRNLAIMETSGSVGTELLRLGAFDPIVQLLLLHADPAQIIDPLPAHEACAWVDHLLALLACITEQSDMGQSALVQSGSIWSLASFAMASTSARDAPVSAVEVLRNLLEETPSLRDFFVGGQHAAFDTLKTAMCSSSSALTRAHIAGLFGDIARLTPAMAGELLPLIAPTLLASLSTDLAQAMTTLICAVDGAWADIERNLDRQRAEHAGSSNMFQPSFNGRRIEDVIETAWDAPFQAFRAQCLATQTAAEVLANLVCSSGDAYDDEEWPVALVQSCLAVDQLLPQLMARACTLPAGTALQLPEDVAVTSELLTSRARDLIATCSEHCLDCIGNLVVNGVAGNTLDHICDASFGLLRAHIDAGTPYPSVVEAINRVLSLTLSSAVTTSADHSTLIALPLTDKNAGEGARRSAVCALAKLATGNIAHSGAVGRSLLDRVQHDPSQMVFVEAVNGLIDVFADDGVHGSTMSSMNLLPILHSALTNNSKWTYNANDRECSDFLDETRANLESFIDYRSSCP